MISGHTVSRFTETCVRSFSVMTCTMGTDVGIHCRQRNWTYVNTSLTCKSSGKNSIYIGETCRSLMERHGEHLADLKAKSEKSHMFNHVKDEHCGVANFQIKPIKTHRSSMMRQISESIAIKLNTMEGANILNSKLEYN